MREIDKNQKLEEIKQIAKAKCGKCLSEIYTNNHLHLSFKCEFGHSWSTSAKMIKNGSWCPHCYDSDKHKLVKRKPEKILEVKQRAIENGGRCLSETYINNSSPLNFECDKGHKWETNWKCINKGAWCPVCFQSRQLIIEPNGEYYQDIINIVSERYGKCLSDIYQGAHSKMKFECKLGHVWMMKPNDIKNGRWCPTCSSGLSERICKLYFEHLFDKPFPKIRPSWLRNADGNLMELDGYCEELGIAFEHNGEQHYKIVNKFKMNDDSLVKRQESDAIKQKLCKENGVKLIVIPPLFYVLKLRDLKDFIFKECAKLDIKVTKSIEEFNPKVGLAYLPEEIKKRPPPTGKIQNIVTITDAHKIAINNKGRCLSTIYKTNHDKLEWQCGDCDRVWEASYNAVQSGTWCPICKKKFGAKKRLLGLEPYQEAAKLKGGECLSTEYINSHCKLQWKCKKGHIWFAKGYAIKNSKQWCSECYKTNKKEIDNEW